jgi:hypothetical protein
MELLIMQFSPTSSHSFLFDPNILLSALFSPSVCVPPPSFTPIQNHRQDNSFIYSNFYVFK